MITPNEVITSITLSVALTPIKVESLKSVERVQSLRVQSSRVQSSRVQSSRILRTRMTRIERMINNKKAFQCFYVVPTFVITLSIREPEVNFASLFAKLPTACLHCLASRVL